MLVGISTVTPSSRLIFSLLETTGGKRKENTIYSYNVEVQKLGHLLRQVI